MVPNLKESTNSYNLQPPMEYIYKSELSRSRVHALGNNYSIDRQEMNKIVMDLILQFIFYSLLVSSAGLPSISTADDSPALAGNDPCVSVVLHEFYKNASLQARFSDTPCNSHNKSAGVFWLEKSTNISVEQLITPHLRIGVPIKTGFLEFMKVDHVNSDGSTTPTGFPIDVFEAAIATLPYKITYKYFAVPGDHDDPDYYNHLIFQVQNKVYDAVVGDTTITASRSDKVDFTYQYIDAGVGLIVPTKSNDPKSLWWFMKPLTLDLWLTTLVAAVLKCILVWFFEKGINPEYQGPPSKLVGKILSFSLSTFVFAHHERLESNYSRFIVNLWIFLVFILMTAFAANLTSMLTVDKLQPTIADLETLRRNGDRVGYPNGTFVFDLLQNEGFPTSRIIPYSTEEQYQKALELGSSKGGVSAIMDEIPYIRVFLKHHCGKYTMTGRIYRRGGFGFVFPRGSAMVSDISRAVMNFTEGDDMYRVENKWFGDESTCFHAGTPSSNERLPLYSLRSIYIMIGVASIVALIFYYFYHFYKRAKVHVAPNRSATSLQQNAMVELINYSGVRGACLAEMIENQPKNDNDLTSGENENDIVGYNDLSNDEMPSFSRKEDTKA